MVPPHPSSQLSQSKPAEAHVRGTHGEQSPAVPPEGQVPSALQLPQSRKLPQPSGTLPHAKPASAHVIGTHVANPQQSVSSQTSGGSVIAPQQLAERPGYTQVHEPHWIKPPQPSEAGPFCTPRSAQVWGWQSGDAHGLHSPVIPPAPHASLAGHEPQLSRLPQPSPTSPQS